MSSDDLPIDEMIQIGIEVDLGIPREWSKVKPSADELAYRLEFEQWMADLRAEDPHAQIRHPFL